MWFFGATHLGKTVLRSVLYEHYCDMNHFGFTWGSSSHMATWPRKAYEPDGRARAYSRAVIDPKNDPELIRRLSSHFRSIHLWRLSKDRRTRFGTLGGRLIGRDAISVRKKMYFTMLHISPHQAAADHWLDLCVRRKETLLFWLKCLSLENVLRLVQG